MEVLIANIFTRFLIILRNMWKTPRYWWWAKRNLHKEKQLVRLQKRVLNELDALGIKLSTKFIVTYFMSTAYHVEEDKTILFPLAYMNPKFRLHGDAALSYVRHEYGHAVMTEYYQNYEYSDVVELFGDPFESYDTWKFLCWKSRRWDKKNYITRYAQVHPEEDFCETFFVYLQKKGKVDQFKNRPGVYEKMLLVKIVIDAVADLSKDV